MRVVASLFLTWGDWWGCRRSTLETIHRGVNPDYHSGNPPPPLFHPGALSIIEGFSIILARRRFFRPFLPPTSFHPPPTWSTSNPYGLVGRKSQGMGQVYNILGGLNKKIKIFCSKVPPPNRTFGAKK